MITELIESDCKYILRTLQVHQISTFSSPVDVYTDHWACNGKMPNVLLIAIVISTSIKDMIYVFIIKMGFSHRQKIDCFPENRI